MILVEGAKFLIQPNSTESRMSNIILGFKRLVQASSLLLVDSRF